MGKLEGEVRITNVEIDGGNESDIIKRQNLQCFHLMGEEIMRVYQYFFINLKEMLKIPEEEHYVLVDIDNNTVTIAQEGEEGEFTNVKLVPSDNVMDYIRGEDPELYRILMQMFNALKILYGKR